MEESIDNFKYSPDAQYPNLSEELQPFLRRLTTVIHMTSDGSFHSPAGSFHSPDIDIKDIFKQKQRAPSPAQL